MTLEESSEDNSKPPGLGVQSPSRTQPLSPSMLPQDMQSLLSEIATFLLALVGAVALGLGITEYLSEKPYILAYLLAYAGFRIADAMVSLPPDLARRRHRHWHEKLGHLPVLLFFAAAPFERTYLFGGDAPNGLAGIGLVIELVGLWIGLGARLQLSKFAASGENSGTGNIIIKTGFYRRIRHPIYTGDFMVMLAWPLMYAAPITELITLWYGFRALRQRMKVEESILLDRLGQDYTDYVKKSDRLIPGVY